MWEYTVITLVVPHKEGIQVTWRDAPFTGEVHKALLPQGLTCAEIIASVPDTDTRRFLEIGTFCINGEPVPRDMWMKVRPKANRDLLVTMHMPIRGGEGGGKTAIRLIATIALLVVATLITGGAAAGILGSTFAAGTIGAQVLAGAVTLAGSLLLGALIKPPSQQLAAKNNSDSEAGSLQASLSGNSLRRGAPLPRVVGEIRVFPPFLSQPLVEVTSNYNEVIEGVYGLAGPHRIRDLKFGTTPVEEIAEGDIDYEILEGLDTDPEPTLFSRYGRTMAPNIQLSKHLIRMDADVDAERDSLLDQLDPTTSLPYGHQVSVRGRGFDEVWVTLNFPGGLNYFEDDFELTWFYSVPFRVRIRELGSAIWINLPEVHVNDRRTSSFSRMMKFVWSEAPRQNSEASPSKGWSLAYYSVPTQTLTPSGQGGWTADSHFYSGSGTTYLGAGVSGGSGLRNTAVEEVSATFYLDGLVNKGPLEIEITRGQIYPSNKFTASSYTIDRNPPTSGSGVINLFGWFTETSQDVTLLKQAGSSDAVIIQRVSQVWNSPPIRTRNEFATVYLRVRGVVLDTMSVLAGGYVNEWNRGARTGAVDDTGLAIDFLAQRMRIANAADDTMDRFGRPEDLITFTRASVASYTDRLGLISYAQADEMRYDYDPVTRVNRGYLAEGARTNDCLQSGNLRVSPWSLFSGTTVAKGPVAPDRFTFWTSIIEAPSGSGSISHRVSQDITIAASAVTWISVYLKRGTRKRALVQHFNFANWATRTYAVVDLDLGTIITVGGSGSPAATIEPGPGGSYRVSIYGVASGGAATRTIGIGPKDDAATTDAGYTGDGAGYIFAWGVQCEVVTAVSPIQSSYIPTTTVAASRSADDAYIPLASLPWNLSIGAMYVDAVINRAGTFEVIAAVAPDVESTGSRIVLGYSGTANGRHLNRDGGTSGALIDSAATIAANAPLRAAVAWNGTTDIAVSFNGVAVQTDNSYTLASDLTRLWIGLRPSTANLFGHIRHINLFPRRATNAELVAWAGGSAAALEVFPGAWDVLDVTSYPPAHYRDVLSGRFNADPIPLALLDDEELIDWWYRCKEQDFTCDTVFEGLAALRVAEVIASCGYAQPRQSELWDVAQDRDFSSIAPAQVFTPRNMKGFRWDKAFIRRRPEGLRVSFQNRDEDFVERTIIVPREDILAGQAGILEEIRYDGLVDEHKVVAKAVYDQLQSTERFTFYRGTVDAEILVCRRGDLVLVQHDILDEQAGFARLERVSYDTNGDAVGFILDSSVPQSTSFFTTPTSFFTTPTAFFSNTIGASIRLTDGTVISFEAFLTGDDDNILVPTAPVENVNDTLLTRDCVVTTGKLQRQNRRLIVFDIRPRADLTADVTFVDEAPTLARFSEPV